MPTPEQIQNYQAVKDSGEFDTLPPERQARLAAIYEPLIGGQLTETIHPGTDFEKTVTAQFPWAPPGMTSLSPVERKPTQSPMYQKMGIYSGPQKYEPTKPTVTSEIQGDPSFLKELVNETNKVGNMMVRGIPFLPHSIKSALNSLTGQTEREIENAPGWQSFITETPANIAAFEGAGAVIGKVGGAIAKTGVGSMVIKAVSEALPTFTKAGKIIAPGISGKIEEGLTRKPTLQQIQRDLIEVPPVKSVASNIAPETTAQKVVDQFGFTPATEKAASPIMMDSPEQLAMMQRIGAQMDEGAGTGVPKMEGFKPISPENIGGAPPVSKLGNLNFEQIPTKDEATRGFVWQMMSPNEQLFYSARMGGNKPIGAMEAARLGDELGISMNYFKTRNLGDSLGTVEAGWLRQKVPEMDKALTELRPQLDLTKPADQEKWLTKISELFRIRSILSGGTSEAARVLAYAKQVSPKERMMEKLSRVFQKTVDINTDPLLKKRILQASKYLDVNDPNSIAQFMSMIGDSRMKRFNDAHFEYWVNSILSGITTTGANVLGNSTATLVRPLEKGAAAMWDAGLTKAGNAMGMKLERERFIQEVVPSYVGAVSGMRKGSIDFLNTMRGDASRISGAAKFGVESSRFPKIPDRYGGKFWRTPGNLLRAQDDFAKAVNYQAEISTQAVRQAMKEGATGDLLTARIKALEANPVQAMEDEALRLSEGKSPDMIKNAVQKARAIGHKMEKEAFREAQYQTFTQKLGPTAQAFQYFVKQTPGLRFVQPFMATMVNLTKYAAERTPAGLLLIPGKSKGEVADILGKVTVGTGIAGSIAAIYAEGGMTGAAPKDPELAKAFYAAGKKPYSISIGEHNVQFKNLGSIGLTLSMVADAMDMWSMLQQDQSAEALAVGIFNSAKGYLNQTYMTGISDLMNAYSDPTRYAGKLWNRFLQGHVPVSGLLRNVATMIDPQPRRPENSVQAIEQIIPFLSRNVPPIYTVWGDEVKYDNGFWAGISPIQWSIKSKDPASLEIDRLHVQSGSINKTLAKIGKSNLKYSSPGYYLAEQIKGQYAHEQILDTIRSDSYRSADDYEKAQALKDEFAKADEQMGKDLDVQYNSKFIRSMMTDYESAKARHQKGKMEQIKNDIKSYVIRETRVRGNLPKTHKFYNQQIMEAKVK